MHSSSRTLHRSARRRRWCGTLVAVAGLGLALAPAAPAWHPDHRGGHDKGIGAFAQRNLVSDVPGAAELLDPSLVNPWGLAFGPATPAWVADNGTDLSTLYSDAGGAGPVAQRMLTVSITGGAPTGAVFNGSASFVVHSGMSSGPALFLFSSETGAITGWNPNVPPGSTVAQTAATVPGAIFKGLAIASTATGGRLYATDFHNGRVDVFDESFDPITIAGAFEDPSIPTGYAPFGIQVIGGAIFVTYAKQDADAEDDVAGAGFGFVDMYSLDGALLGRVATQGVLNAPWGLAMAPDTFGEFGGDLLVGNFGDGTINAYERESDGGFELDGSLHRRNGNVMSIDGLWAIQFGNGAIAGPTDSLFFTAGPNDERHGLFGKVEAQS